ncbi:hypothetical protein CEXT_778521 [Caerostris extrusa]|uniref:Uncharacterized protein n=1 Tax=Caerostris extrusa TaxID=172846 RepID=A0AAV4TXG9_CAEEX|nr:hypothetical protein CEXT_778521 [Caerostris extrusa]
MSKWKDYLEIGLAPASRLTNRQKVSFRTEIWRWLMPRDARCSGKKGQPFLPLISCSVSLSACLVAKLSRTRPKRVCDEVMVGQCSGGFWHIQ